MVVVPLVSLYSHGFAESSKQDGPHKTAQVLKDCISTITAFESQVESHELNVASRLAASAVKLVSSSTGLPKSQIH